jgi:light-regulated signal transduction histidine kinase (bacteriophytochrome)
MSSDRIFPIRSVLESGSYIPASNEEDNNNAQEELLVWSNGRFVNCDEEPIHIPGSIQSYGALIAIEEISWIVRQVSENSKNVIGVSPNELLKSKSLKEFLTGESIDILADHINSASHFPEDSGPDIFRMFMLNDHNSAILYCALHRNEENENLLILEFVREDKTLIKPTYVPSKMDLKDELDPIAKRRRDELK